MNEKVNSGNIVLFVVIFLVIILLIGSLFYYNIKKHASAMIEATVKYVGSGYIVVEDEEKQEYSLETDNDYNVGDKVSFVIKDIKKDSNPKEGTVEKIDTLSKSVQFSIMDPEKTESDSEESITQEQSSGDYIDTTVETKTTQNPSTNTDSDDVVSYFETLNQNLDTYNQDKSLGQSIKNGFVTVVDFLFYDGTIKGKTFDELSDSAKLKVLKLAFSIDSKIDQHFPGYKEEISKTGSKIYTNVKSKAIEAYLNITTKVCENQPDTCNSAKQGLSELKTNFSLTWNFIKDISGIGVSKLKAWYEVWKVS